MIIERYYNNLNKLLPDGKVLIIYGPRRVGKTTLINLLLKDIKLKYKIDTGDSIHLRNILCSDDLSLIKEYVSGYDLLVIDEAQNIPDIGRGLKIMNDYIPDLKIMVTGSSSFDIQQKVSESLTGRKKIITLFPLSMLEINKFLNKHEIKERVEEFLVFGTYPEIYTQKNKNDKIELLQELVNSYLLKDILGFDRLKNPKQLIELLKLLAFQVGSEVSVHELANNVKLNVRTVDRYLDLLERGFIIHRLGAYNNNLRNEITKKSKYYFYDNGIRNAIIMQFNNPGMRNDTGQLWENFLINERLKYLSYKKMFVNRYFWRTYQQKEIDYIEERDALLYAFEFKWNKKQKKIPDEFNNAYNVAAFKNVNRNNFLDFVL